MERSENLPPGSVEYIGPAFPDRGHVPPPASFSGASQNPRRSQGGGLFGMFTGRRHTRARDHPESPESPVATPRGGPPQSLAPAVEQRPQPAPQAHPSSHLWGQPFRSHLAVGSMVSSHLRQQELRPGGRYQPEAYHLEQIRQEVLEFRRQHENDWKFNDAI
ncbi:hypothetical protein ASPACDRAFT_1854798 [Aspergillus aculeatus ATCC 16872]|uniref:Uncharacterized protein n=1 Tax=Aspergillus aculeatus (strain ATCC 16872 / CBS 172.66 / WB 5094) TaxID=690307 RepID=A0A1L9WYU7_ASPA1|nr:uncharacterized protein ASPACDRAFT_1854798 [Aspergillus aculeatus ATCC 16872]OJK01422.1 hypothetical protein ASPACDRAFT_1854798 [Aspergillus aculeatus ATCC 16872]